MPRAAAVVAALLLGTLSSCGQQLAGGIQWQQQQQRQQAVPEESQQLRSLRSQRLNSPLVEDAAARATHFLSRQDAEGIARSGSRAKTDDDHPPPGRPRLWKGGPRIWTPPPGEDEDEERRRAAARKYDPARIAANNRAWKKSEEDPERLELTPSQRAELEAAQAAREQAGVIRLSAEGMEKDEM